MTVDDEPETDPEPTPTPAPRGVGARLRSHLVDLTPLRGSRDFRLLFLGKSISDFGDEIVAVAVPFQVYDLTHSTLAVGLLGLCELFPVLVLPIIGGAAADAVERRRLTIVTHVVLAVMSIFMAINASLEQPMLWPLYVFATISAGMYTFNRPAISTWPARLMPISLLPSAFALEASLGTLAGMTGPIVAGLLLRAISPAGVFLFDAFTFLVVVACVWRMRPSPPVADSPRFGVESIKEGLRFLKGKRVIQAVFAADLTAMAFGLPAALFPAIAAGLAKDPANSPLILGSLYAALSVGAFLGTMFSGRVKHVRRQGRAILICIVVWGTSIVVFGYSDTLWLSLAMLAIAGAGDMISGIFRRSILQTVVNDAMRGRIDGIGMAGWATGPSVGSVESGVVATLTSVRFSVVSGGLLCILGVVLIWLLAPAMARYDSREPHA